MIGPAPTGEAAALVAIQGALADRPGVLPAARGLSHFGEHSLGWLAISGIGWALAVRRDDEVAQRRWIEAGVGAFGAHAASVIIKRIVRRRRPHDPRIVVGVSTPSRLSFPSSHATSTTAAAILIGRAAGLPPYLLPAALVPPMLTSRLVLGVHYPSDVAAGAAIGALSAGAVVVGDQFIERAADTAARHPTTTRLAGVAARLGALALVPGSTARLVMSQLVGGKFSNRENA
ncbi:phosphatase PAP2 family protein [Gordonia sp. VNK1]